MKNDKKGFTLIELLVVMSVVGVMLTMTVLAISPTEKVNKAKDVELKSAMNSLRIKINEAFLKTYPFEYSNAKTDSEVLKLSSMINGYSMEANVGSWAAKAQLSSGDYYCIDSDSNVVIKNTQDITDFQCD